MTINATVMTMDQIRLAGLKALSRELGPVGMIRFLQQFETGSSDYTRERQLREDNIDAATLAAKIQTWRQNVEGQKP
ncbi:MAG: hypothetical protein KC519_14050 [Anaerolineae bacterium]|nr:hypothetical protein [Anaerolineae bacterium]